MKTKKMLKEIAAYCRNNIEDYELRVQLALKRMERNRCSLRMADSELFDEMVDAISDWCADNDFSIDFFEDWDDLIEGDEGILWEC